MVDLVKKIEKSGMQETRPEINPGDTVSVSLRILEGDKERVQTFTGIIIQKRGAGLSKTFTVRKASGGIYVERIFPLHSPLISDITITRRGAVRRAKLFYLRERIGKAVRIKEKK